MPIILSTNQRKFDKCYKVTDESLGNGSNGNVKTVVCKRTGQNFALKSIDIKTNKKCKEAKTELAVFNLALGHENLVQMREVFQDYSSMYFVMEKLDGDLNTYCKHNGLLKEREAALVIRDVAKALSHLHNLNVAHRDVKLNNIFLSGKNLFPIKLGDYGLCSDPGAETCYETHGKYLYSRPVGTVIYVPPEIAKLYQGNPGHYTKQCDMWSLGVVLYAILIGNLPFDIGFSERCEHVDYISFHSSVLNAIVNKEFNMDSAWESIPAGAKDLIRNLLVKDPNERYTVDEVLKHPWIKHWNHGRKSVC